MAESGYYMKTFTMVEHTSTYMDAPEHFVEGKWMADQIPLERLYGDCVIMDARDYITHSNDIVTADEIRDWEKRTGIAIPEESILFVYTGWGTIGGHTTLGRSTGREQGRDDLDYRRMPLDTWWRKA